LCGDRTKADQADPDREAAPAHDAGGSVGSSDVALEATP
jgi:hypothetical protein